MNKVLLPSEVARILSPKLENKLEPITGNWLRAEVPVKREKIYFSQCKPAAAGNANWQYEFFHSISLSTIERVCEDAGRVILINYFDQTLAILEMSDLLWLARLSVRKKSNSGLVMDIVIDRNSSGQYQLRPYDRFSKERRPIEVQSW